MPTPKHLQHQHRHQHSRTNKHSSEFRGNTWATQSKAASTHTFAQPTIKPSSAHISMATMTAATVHSPSFRDSSTSHTLSQPADFEGEVNTNNDIPSQAVLKSVENVSILDQEGRSIPFKNLYSGPNVARRVMVIFIRHFYCGNCQEYIRALTSSITPSSLLSLPIPTFIAIVGCGAPSLIPMYQEATSCPFPIYADPTKKLYSALGMLRTLNMGTRPEYQRKDQLSMVFESVVQAMKKIKDGQALKGGDMHQVGGEFLFEPVDMNSPLNTPEPEADSGDKQLGDGAKAQQQEGGWSEEKRITWCHRMKNTRDHAEIPELREALGLSGEGAKGKNEKRWSKALVERKGTGLNTVKGTVDSPDEAFRKKVRELDEGVGISAQENHVR
ncbi:fmHP [Drepanopeziza brunnea f. sp. 'multigermtubi' MB_m1]|uniref:FmHP n=1 Tax=Marssonina brunnea f. sp. multigermtubi (strain MB_m1) TaxID=1072389 RepID=K1WRH2_MARBU|nr:fmHP [Drepanopeziza brunnea f. sp. 'multigermtubi' MB_m1]EKD20245.1 fmHP [Drepanopeziza brunnea f. sp. 'multigermtubi' MB_m1]